jgi:hypothetical protein
MEGLHMRRLWMRLVALALVAMMTAVGALAEGGEGLESALVDDAVPECEDVLLPEAGSPAEVSAPLPGEPDTKPEIMAERGDFEIVDGVLVAYYGSGGDTPHYPTTIGFWLRLHCLYLLEHLLIAEPFLRNVLASEVLAQYGLFVES